MNWRRVLGGAAVTGLVLVVAALAAIEWRWTRRFEAAYPSITSSHDPEIVARGEYLVYSAAACAYCHVPREEWDRLDKGERLPLTGITCSGCRSGISTRRT